MSKRIVLGLLATVLCSSVNADPSVGLRFRPKDECIHVKGYFEFRRSFEDLVRKRDGQALFAMIASDVVLEIGGLSGKENFAKKWNLAAGEASPIWSELDKIIRLGCFAESDRGLMMPHMTALDPHWSADRVSPKALVLGEYIDLRAGPGANTASLGLLTWEFVQMNTERVGPGWVAIKTRGGKSGFVQGSYLRSHLDYSINFQKDSNGAWSIHAMTAGD